MAPRAAAQLDAQFRELGHELVGVITMRNDRRPDRFAALVGDMPAQVDVAVPGTPHRVAPLLRAFEPDLAVCMGFGWRIRPDALAVPRLGILNSHPSLLPRWRGPNPFGWTFRGGDSEAGYTFHLMDADFDTGPILAQGAMPIDDDDTIQTLFFERSRELTGDLLARAIARLESGDRGDPQSSDGALHAPVFEDEYTEIDWTQPARDVHNQVRAWFIPSVSGIMGALTTLAGTRVRVLKTQLANGGVEAKPGAILDVEGKTLLVQCGDAPIRILETEPV
jgi:methionyl-tRNA formyltransferase